MRQLRFVFAATLAASTLGACATKGYVKKGLENQRVALSTQMTTDMTTERGERSANDTAIRADVARVAADLAALRSELQALKTEFNAKITAMDGQVAFAFPVHFGFDDATVRAEDQAALERFATVANKHYHGAMITVEGFADPAGSVQYNLNLSRERAENVRDFLATKGLDSSVVKTVGYGKTRLVRKGASGNDAGADLNRRVSFVIETPSMSTVAALTMPATNSNVGTQKQP